MDKELDRSWLPQPESLPDGGVRMRLPSDTEWMLAGGTVKKETHSMPAYNVREDWRDILDKWLQRWQDKNNEPGRAPGAYVKAYKLLIKTEELGFGVDFISRDEARRRAKEWFPGASGGELDNIMKFVDPLLVETTMKYSMTEMKGPSEEEEEEE